MGTGTGAMREKYKGKHRHHGEFFIEKYDFIELKSEEQDFSLDGFKLLGISVENRPFRPPSTAPLWN